MATQLGTHRDTGEWAGPQALHVPARSWSVAATSDRLLGERLDGLMADLARNDGRLPATSIARLARLVSAMSTLRDAHAVDDEGRCLRCRASGRRLWQHRRQDCTVYAVLDDFIGHEPSPLLHERPH
jgi:hypothetical protein